MKKQMLSIILTLCMVICLVPTNVFAESQPNMRVREVQSIAAQSNCTVHNFSSSTGKCTNPGCDVQCAVRVAYYDAIKTTYYDVSIETSVHKIRPINVT